MRSTRDFERCFSITTISEAVLLAGGLGTRLKPFSEKVPKPFLPVLGVPAAQFALDAIRAAGIRRAVINVHHLPSVARKAIEGLDGSGLELVVSDESELLLGSGGGIRRASILLSGERVFVLNADVLQAPDLVSLERRHLELASGKGVSLTLLLSRRVPVGAKYREVRVDPSGRRIEGLGEPGEAVGGGCLFTGASIIERGCLVGLPEGPSDFIEQVLRPAIAAGRAGCLIVDDPVWIDLGSAELWWRAHFTVMDAWEARLLPKAWGERILRAARRIQSGVWIGVSDPAPLPGTLLLPRVFHLRGSGSPLPRIGPDAVVYGTAPQGALSRGICHLGDWITF